MIGAPRILESLNRHRCAYVVIGALAATLQGSPLRTDDLDICPESSDENLKRVADALGEIEATEWDPHKGEAVDRRWDPANLKGDSLWILHTRYGRLDLLMAPHGTNGYDDLAKDAKVVEVDGLRVPVASLESIIRMKEAAGRDKDLAQLPTLRRLLDRLE